MDLSDKAKEILLNKLSVVKMLIIEEMSMVSRALFYKTHARLLETFMSPTSVPFAALSVVVLDDFLQLWSVRRKPIYALINDHEKMKGFFKFKFVEYRQICWVNRGYETEMGHRVCRVP